MTDLLKAVRPERALFTTFTLSLNWFESFCLPLLKLEGCEHIDLLVDSREACKLSAETSSAYAGNTYRVMPVYMNNSGIFHPKVAYLQGTDDDTLVVGSGNLTAPGQGGNLEVIDAVNAADHPHVFEQFATFLDLFAKRPGLAEDTLAVLRTYALRARYAAARASEEVRAAAPTAWLIHTLVDPAHIQLGKLVEDELDNPSQLTIFSPYHTGSGKAVAAVTDACGVIRTRIGLQPERSPESGELILVAPFQPDARYLPKNHGFVTAETTFAPRRLHAKCFEVLGSSGCVVMTGSVNATWQSLCDTRNVEISLARKLEHSPFSWKAAKPDVAVPCEYAAQDYSGPAVALQASWNEEEITGTIAPAPEAGQVRLEVWSRLKMEFPVDAVVLNADGTFRVKTAQTCDTVRALRLKVLRHDEVLAIGWLNVERELACPAYERDVSRAAASIVAGKPKEGDLRRILDYFKRILRRERALAEQATAQAASTASVDVGKRADAWTKTDQERLGVTPGTAEQVLAAAFATLRERARQPTEGAGSTPAEFDPAHGDDEAARPAGGQQQGRKPPQRKRRPVDDPFSEMLKTLPAILAVNATGPWMSGLISRSAGALLHQVPREAEDPDADGPLAGDEERVVFGRALRQWVGMYSQFAYSAENRTRLLPLVCAVAGCAIVFGGTEVSVPRLKENLETLAQRPILDHELLDWVDDALGTPPFATLDPGERSLALEAALTLGSSGTTQQDLEALVLAVMTGAAAEPGGPEDARFERYAGVRKVLADLWTIRERTGKGRVFGVISAAVKPLTRRTRCPACDTPLESRDMIARLQRDGASLHDGGCNMPVFVGLSWKVLAAAQVPRTAYDYEGPREAA
ncbi:hypothetical protein F6X40_10170 [Paraburkholderia sp. UCT31]|uniref:hypothetical protein n=1 Tax=Paraburkholderia sp. UCT31 TaxID=2615209 RepID=UPI001656113B|nr:hypothetical protein [Paraburkholderia sp. UCT31]MBC8737173.1 hypothetical protein [Paraburkholderia sp. UCT31]